MLLGVVDMYEDLLIAAPSKLIGIVFFFVYIIFMFLILINIFLAILNDAYAGVKGDIEEKKEERKFSIKVSTARVAGRQTTGIGWLARRRATRVTRAWVGEISGYVTPEVDVEIGKEPASRCWRL